MKMPAVEAEGASRFFGQVIENPFGIQSQVTDKIQIFFVTKIFLFHVFGQVMRAAFMINRGWTINHLVAFGQDVIRGPNVILPPDIRENKIIFEHGP